MNARDQAVRTAGYRLERIETWTRRAFFAGVICAVALAIIAGAVINLVIDYTRAKSAMAEASRKMSEDMKTRFPVAIKGGLR